MKRVKKGAFALSSLLVALSLVTAGCGGNGINEAANNQPANNAQGSASAEKTLDPYEVVMVYPDGKQNDLGNVQAAMNDYLKTTYPALNISVKLNPIDWSAYADKTNLMMSSGQKFDLIWTANWMNFDAQVNKGGLLPLDDLLAKHGQDIEAVEGQFHDGAKRSGKIYGVHVHQELGNPQGIALSKALVDKYNLDLSGLKSGEFKDLTPILKTIKDNEPSITPAVGPAFPLNAYYGSGSTANIVGPVSLDLKDTDPNNTYKVINTYETPRYMELAKLTREWFKAGYINKDATTPGIDVWKKFQAGTAFAAIGSDLDILAGTAIGEAQLMPSKTGSVGSDIVQVPLNIDRLQTTKLAATMQGISQTSKDPERAMMLLNLFYRDQKLLTLFNFGVEGTHYVLKDGQIALPEGKSQETVGFYHDVMWQIGNQMLNYTRVGEDPNKYKNYEEFNKKVADNPSPILGFVFDSEPVKNELIAVSKVQSTFDPGLQSGQLDPEVEVPKLIEKLKAAGVDKIIAEAQKQLDAWRAENGK